MSDYIVNIDQNITNIDQNITNIEQNIVNISDNIASSYHSELNQGPGVDVSKKDLTNITVQKPFLKWVGGKTQIINTIINKLPNKMNNYHEIFLGGGSVLFAILSLQKAGVILIKNKIYAYDLNIALINTYKQIQKDYKSVIENVSNLKKEFEGIKINTLKQRGAPKNINETNYNSTREHYYYWIREKYIKCNKMTLEAAGYFIFLNKTGFRGMYREGPKGFNIPYGLKDKKNIPKIINEKEIKKISELIQNVEFKIADFKDSIENVNYNDFVYLDPPYAPENENSFVGYTSSGFNIDDHNTLFDKILEFDNKNCKFMMSNAKVDLVTNKFKDYNIYNIIAKRAINSKNPGSKTTEVLIQNYI